LGLRRGPRVFDRGVAGKLDKVVNVCLARSSSEVSLGELGEVIGAAVV